MTPLRLFVGVANGWLFAAALIRAIATFADGPVRQPWLQVVDVIVAGCLLVAWPIDRSRATKEGFDTLRKGMEAFYGKR
jgi:hypothetical protein